MVCQVLHDDQIELINLRVFSPPSCCEKKFQRFCPSQTNRNSKRKALKLIFRLRESDWSKWTPSPLKSLESSEKSSGENRVKSNHVRGFFSWFFSALKISGRPAIFLQSNLRAGENNKLNFSWSKKKKWPAWGPLFEPRNPP